LKKIGYSYLGQPERLIPGAFYNNELDSAFSKNDCGQGYTGASVIYTVPAYKYNSTTSQLDADKQARKEASDNGQSYANQKGTCIPAYSNSYQSRTFTKNDCGKGYVGSTVVYDINAGIYRATTQDGADQLAINDINANGQAHANQWGTCFNSSWPFVRIANANWHQDSIGNEYEDVVVYFYQDFACTIPITVSNLNISVQTEFNSANANSSTYTSQNFTVSGTSSVIISNVMTYGFENGDNVWRKYSLLPVDGYNLP
jgi:hypothetical protein